MIVSASIGALVLAAAIVHGTSLLVTKNRFHGVEIVLAMIAGTFWAGLGSLTTMYLLIKLFTGG